MTTSRSTRRHETASQALLRLDPGNLRRPSETAMALNPLDRVRNTRPGDLTCTVSARITQAEADALTALATRNGCSKAALMRELLRDGLAPLLEG